MVNSITQFQLLGTSLNKRGHIYYSYQKQRARFTNLFDFAEICDKKINFLDRYPKATNIATFRNSGQIFVKGGWEYCKE